MRNELELIATIEKYLNNGLSAEEKTAFENKLAEDPQLREAVGLQQEVMKGIENLSLKGKIKKARKRFYRVRNFKRWGITGLIITATIISILLYFKQRDRHTPGAVGFNEQNQRQWAAAGQGLPSQVFVIHAGNDTIVETKSGLVIQVPANGFLDENKQPVTGTWELIIQEAMDAASIMRAGLSSTSGDRLLESGGMFLVDARQNGKNLTVNPATGLYIERPTDTLLPGMQLFKGNRLPDGRIDWVDPKSLAQDLTPVDIRSLNFYPPGYLDSLAKWGYDSRNKKFTDSLYYSFADVFVGESGMIKQVQITDSSSGEGDQLTRSRPCGINPAKIKAIWNDHFQNTLLATREFEERLTRIFQSDDNDVLDLYINNLDKNLSNIDSMAARLVSGTLKLKFLAFAARQDGKVKIGSALTQQLRKYYETKTRIFIEAVAKTNRAFWEKQAQLDNIAAARQAKHTNDSLERTDRLFAEELEVNLKSAYRQLGYDTSITPRIPQNKVYKVAIITTGWYNIDRFVNEVTTARTTGSYTDPQTGKTATIKYEPVSFQINKPEQYDELYVYLLPDKLSSFMRLPQAKGTFTESLNEGIQYKLVCIAYKNDQPFYYMQPDIEPKEYTGIELAAITQPDLTRLLNREKGPQLQSEVQQERAFIRFYQHDAKRQQRNLDLQELWTKIFHLIYHCDVGGK